jgi:hypothetical protein
VTVSRRLSAALVALALLLAVAGTALVHEPEPVGRTPPTDAVGPPVRRHAAGSTSPEEVIPAAPDAPDARAVFAARPIPGRTLILTDLPAREGEPAAIAAALLDEHRAALGLVAMPGELQHERSIDGLSGHHLRLRQVVAGVPVHGSRVSAHVGHDGRPLMLRADVYPLRGLATDALVPTVASESARSIVAEWLADDDPEALPDVREPALVVLPRGREGVLCWEVAARTTHQILSVFVDAADGEIVHADELAAAAEGRGMVFKPNPIHSEGNGSLRDQGDRDLPVLTAARHLVTLPRLDGNGQLRGQWADLTASPVLAFDRDLDWTWATRSHHVFEQVNCYYHVDRVQDLLQSLGFTNVNAESQRINAHSGKADQSIYNVLDDELEFGDGGVDDGEDADVVVHEYGHAMQFDQVGSFSVVNEGGAMGEGFGDFLAVLMHESGRPSWDVLFASWDAAALVDQSPPFLRRVDRNKRFPEDYERQVHEDGEIWSRFLWDLRALIGADDALRVVVESHFYLTRNARFRDGANALIVANIALRDGRDDASIRALMDERGLPYDVPSAPLPPEEASEDNDTAETAGDLDRGVHERLLLADEDWFRVVVPPFRRVLVRADFDPVALDMDLEAYAASGLRSAVSAEAGGVEELTLTAGPVPLTVLVRCFHAEGTPPYPGAYDLTVTETELEAFGPVQNVVRTVEPGQTWAFRISVSPAKVADAAKLRVKTRRKKRGARTDVRVFDPDLLEVVDAETARVKRGGKAVAIVTLPGDWLAVVTPREGQSGPAKLKVKLK